MVSSDAEALITDFGFASVGNFGPPPPSTQKPVSFPSVANTVDAAYAITHGVPEVTARVDVAEKSPSDGQESTRSPGLNASGGGENGGPDMASSELGFDGLPSLGNRCADVDGGMVIPATSTPQAQEATGSVVAAAEAAHVQRSCPAAGARIAPATSTTQAQLATSANSTNSADSPPIGVGKGRRGNGSAQKGSGAREAQGSRRNTADIGKTPNQDSVLYGTIKGYTPRYQSPEVSDIMEKKCKAAAAAAAMATAQTGDRPLRTQAPQVSFLRCLLDSRWSNVQICEAVRSQAAEECLLQRPN